VGKGKGPERRLAEEMVMKRTIRIASGTAAVFPGAAKIQRIKILAVG
jgi:hypothetical protein